MKYLLLAITIIGSVGFVALINYALDHVDDWAVSGYRKHTS
jgi:hypothetical protein